MTLLVACFVLSLLLLITRQIKTTIIILLSIFTTIYALELGQDSWYHLPLAPDGRVDTGELGGHVVLLAQGQLYSMVPYYISCIRLIKYFF